MNTRDLEAFVAVVESGSLVRASERLFLTQPGLTRRVQNLETTLGIELLDRQSKPLKPTAAGNEVYGLARSVLRALDDLMSVASPQREPVGELKLGVPPFLSELALEQPVDQLRSEFPKLTLRVRAGWSPGLLDEVERARLDAAVILLPAAVMPPEGVVATQLGYTPTLVVAARSFGLPDEPTTLAALAHHPWVLNQDGCGMRSALSRAMGMAGLPFNVAVEAFGSELQLSLVARGMGIGLAAPQALARSSLRDQLQIIDATDFRSGLNVWLVHGALPGRLVRPVALIRDALTNRLEMAEAA
ncbi:LysR family transcriptional regulator [Paraburkholderia silvatlantica]|uniref:DNA-binding transcriptional LysR family regulator n=1 Tax=Paraburkholderia silvatlantica TaxID=321895 RepID=A0ABR6FSY6_9BURK|nr:LysR family transcriptional regulator [Paraburkholderia silvatlantica]MBB2930518.1 DNA-binding transcriptional LysR family regulator [Paraburkholderia silvatlantica]PVY30325.1 DNA-binding transcriptional LysR family regulator [Paraburkholderia silvatlantica]PXW36938.1 DNA-binding transcriptional LysR family regulator [Paraburkholderia silvatlantica]